MDTNSKERIVQFLAKHTLTVISTIDSTTNKPESALVAFAEDDNLNIVFGTSNTTRKYKNLKANPNVSFVIGWDGRVGTLQYEGIAKELSQEESAPHSARMIAKNPFSEKFVNRDDQRYFFVSPTWIRLTDNTSVPNDILEVTP